MKIGRIYLISSFSQTRRVRIDEARPRMKRCARQKFALLNKQMKKEDEQKKRMNSIYTYIYMYMYI